MSELKIRTNNVPRELIPWYNLPKKEQEEFDYPDDKDCWVLRFVKYRGEFYDVLDTQRISTANRNAAPMGWEMHVEPDSPLRKWHSIVSDSFFSGMLFRFSDDFSMVTVGVFTS